MTVFASLRLAEKAICLFVVCCLSVSVCFILLRRRRDSKSQGHKSPKYPEKLLLPICILLLLLLIQLQTHT